MLITLRSDKVKYFFFPDFVSKNACGKNPPPCVNDAICQSGFTDQGYRCLCTAGYEGEHCEKGSIQKCVVFRVVIQMRTIRVGVENGTK